jgi:hypothetical protein
MPRKGRTQWAPSARAVPEELRPTGCTLTLKHQEEFQEKPVSSLTTNKCEERNRRKRKIIKIETDIKLIELLVEKNYLMRLVRTLIYYRAKKCQGSIAFHVLPYMT